ncbi:MAG: fatty acid desaturase [Vicinamibacterales bacterium]
MHGTALRRPTPPRPADLTHLKPSDPRGGCLVVSCLVLTLAGIALSLRGGAVSWAVGQALTAAALVQWFVILHECGHETLFRTRRWHRLIGPIAGAFAAIPFASWTRIHRRHHKWTGWQDLDPTAVSLLPRRRSPLELAVVNLAWRLWLPLFAVMYRLSNYWHLPRLRRMFPAAQDRRAITGSIAALAGLYLALGAAAGVATALRAAGLAVVLSFAIEDLLLLSQHAHVPHHVSAGNVVRPFPAMEQDVFTRSLRLPSWVSAWLLHFDAHELHHMYPFVPGYHLRAIAHRTDHEIGWWEWIRRAKALPGEVLLFQNRDDSGWDL